MTLGDSRKRSPCLRQTGVAVRSLEEFVAEAGPPPRRHTSSILNGSQIQFPRITPTNQNCEGIVEAQRWEERTSAAGVQIANRLEHGCGIVGERLMKKWP